MKDVRNILQENNYIPLIKLSEYIIYVYIHGDIHEYIFKKIKLRNINCTKLIFRSLKGEHDIELFLIVTTDGEINLYSPDIIYSLTKQECKLKAKEYILDGINILETIINHPSLEENTEDNKNKLKSLKQQLLNLGE